MIRLGVCVGACGLLLGGCGSSADPGPSTKSDDSNSGSAGSAGSAPLGSPGGSSNGGKGGSGQAGAGSAGSASGSGISSMPTCALANDGKCIRPLSRTHDDVCARYKSGLLSPGMDVFTPGADVCALGQTASASIETALARINFYRWLAGVPAITASDHAVATACAGITAHRTDLSQPDVDLHHVMASTPCYSQAGADAVTVSLVAPGPDDPAFGIDDFIYDFGAPNRGVLGHRLWLLDPGLGKVGIGFSRDVSSGMSATCVEPTQYEDFAPQTSLDGMNFYPSPDVFPWDATQTFADQEVLSWTFVLPAVLDLESARVTMFSESAAGLVPLPITFGPIRDGLNEAALWITPQQAPPAGATLVVEIANIPVGAIGYRVQLTDCGTVPAADPDPSPDAGCSVLAQDCPTAAAGCFLRDGGPFDGRCEPSGSYPAGTPCTRDASCVAGTQCSPDGSGQTRCSSFCDFGGAAPKKPCDSTCAHGFNALYTLQLGDELAGIGLCIE